MLSEALKGQYGEQEQQNQQELTQLFNTVSQKGIFGLWRNITGRTAKDKETISRLQANLENIQKRKQEAFAAFEKDRQARLEMMKKQQEQEKFTEQIPANDIKPQIQEVEERTQKIEAFKERMRQQSVEKSQERGRSGLER